MDSFLRILYRSSVVVIFVFMILPLLVVFLASVSPTDTIEIPPSSISFRWFSVVLEPRWLEPLRLSLILGASVSIVATIVGGFGAFAVAYYRCPANSAVMAFLLSPIAAPDIVIAIALLQLFAAMGLHTDIGFAGLFLGHVVVLTPFTARMIVNSLHAFDHNLERAAIVLGANRWQVLRRITLPLLKPGVFAGMTLAFILSFNNIPISLFLAQPGTRTIAVAVLNYLEYRIDPALAAVNVVCLLIILIIVALLERVGGFTKYLYEKAS